MREINKTRYITFSAAIAAIYVLLTILPAPLSYGTVQVRLSEALTILAAFTHAAIPGLFAGCIIANIYTGSLIDIIFGSMTTLAAAALTYRLRRKKWLAPLPPVVLNAAVVGYYLTLQYGGLAYLNILSVGIGQFIACYIIPLYFIVNFEKTKAVVEKIISPNRHA